MRAVVLGVTAVLVASALATVPHRLDCGQFGLPDANYDVRFSVWPFGLECHDVEGEVPVTEQGPGVPASLAWIGLVALLFAGARRSPFVRGAADSACFLALVAAAAVPSEPGWYLLALMLGPGVVFLADRYLRPPAERTAVASILPAAVLPFVVLAAWTPGNFGGLEPLGIAGGLVVGGAVTAGLERLVDGRRAAPAAA